MAVVSCTLNCVAGGFSKITVCFSATRVGSNNDHFKMRIIRRKAGTADYVVPGTPEFVLTGAVDIRSYSFIDPNVPADGAYSYTLQAMRLEGSGTFYEMNIIGEHFKK
jgi:hypothetical protein